MSAQLAGSPEQQLVEAIGSFQHDPLGYVLFNFPWGVKGGPLMARSCAPGSAGSWRRLAGSCRPGLLMLAR